MGEDLELTSEGVSKSEQELIKLYKRRLENWREVLIHLNSLLLWEKPFYPGILSGFVTFIFILLWYFDPSVLTAISCFGIILCILDYVVPLLSSNFFDSRKWTGPQEQKYEEICRNIIHVYLSAHSAYEYTNYTKETRPVIYFIAVLGTLILTAWIGNVINNLFLAYLIVLFMILLPGIKSHDIVQQNISKVISMVKDLIGQKKKKK